MLAIGIDPGTAITGYGLVRENDDGSLTVVDYGAILTGADQPMPKRLVSLYEQLNDILLLHHPDSGAVEKLFLRAMCAARSAWARRAAWSCWPWSGLA